MAKKRLKVWVSGKVQGVCYRAWTQEQANQLGLSGWVRNLPDGRVEWEAEGPQAGLQALLDASHQGPPSAQVSRVEPQWLPYENQFKGFDIRYG